MTAWTPFFTGQVSEPGLIPTPEASTLSAPDLTAQQPEPIEPEAFGTQVELTAPGPSAERSALEIQRARYHHFRVVLSELRRGGAQPGRGLLQAAERHLGAQGLRLSEDERRWIETLICSWLTPRRG